MSCAPSGLPHRTGLPSNLKLYCVYYCLYHLAILCVMCPLRRTALHGPLVRNRMQNRLRLPGMSSQVGNLPVRTFWRVCLCTHFGVSACVHILACLPVRTFWRVCLCAHVCVSACAHIFVCLHVRTFWRDCLCAHFCVSEKS